MKRIIGLLAIGLGLFSGLSGQSQFRNFDSVLLANTGNPTLKKDSQLNYTRNHQIVAVLPPAIERYRGLVLRKPQPYDSSEWLPTVLGLQEMTVQTLRDQKSRYKFNLEIQPIQQTNYIIDSLLRVNPWASDTVIAKALGVDGLIITKQTVIEPTTSSIVATGVSIIANPRINNSLPHTTTYLHYYLKDVATMKSICHYFNTYDYPLIRVRSGNTSNLHLNNSPIKNLPYVTKDYRIKNSKIRKVVNTTVNSILLVGFVGIVVYSLVKYQGQ